MGNGLATVEQKSPRGRSPEALILLELKEGFEPSTCALRVLCAGMFAALSFPFQCPLSLIYQGSAAYLFCGGKWQFWRKECILWQRFGQRFSGRERPRVSPGPVDAWPTIKYSLTVAQPFGQSIHIPLSRIAWPLPFGARHRHGGLTSPGYKTITSTVTGRPGAI